MGNITKNSFDLTFLTQPSWHKNHCVVFLLEFIIIIIIIIINFVVSAKSQNPDGDFTHGCSDSVCRGSV